MRIVRLGESRWLNLNYLILAEPIEPAEAEGRAVLRVVVAPGLARELGPEEAADLRRHLFALEAPGECTEVGHAVTVTGPGRPAPANAAG